MASFVNTAEEKGQILTVFHMYIGVFYHLFSVQTEIFSPVTLRLDAVQVSC